MAIIHNIYQKGKLTYAIPYTVRGGLKFSIKSKSRIVEKRSKQIFEREPLTIQWLESFDKHSVFVDVGANIGSYSLLSAKHKKTTTYAFEPQALNYAELCTNIYLNKLDIIPYCVALSDVDKFDIFHLSELVPGSADNSFAEKSNHTVSQGCYGTRLDSMLESGAIKQPDYIKIDVDGLELNVLRGAEKCLENAKETQVELRKENGEEAEKFLSNLGYSIDYDMSYQLNDYEVNYVFKR